jgi:hypothetical protein
MIELLKKEERLMLGKESGTYCGKVSFIASWGWDRSAGDRSWFPNPFTPDFIN